MLDISESFDPVVDDALTWITDNATGFFDFIRAARRRAVQWYREPAGDDTLLGICFCRPARWLALR